MEFLEIIKAIALLCQVSATTKPYHWHDVCQQLCQKKYIKCVKDKIPTGDLYSKVLTDRILERKTNYWND